MTSAPPSRPSSPSAPPAPPDELERLRAELASSRAELASSRAELASSRAELQAERDRRESSEHAFAALAETVPHIIWAAQPDGALDYFSQRSLDYVGHTHDDLKDWSWQQVLHPDDLPLTIERWTHSLATGDTYDTEFRLRRASDGVYRWHLVRAQPQRDAAGRIVRWFGTCTDVHDQKVAEVGILSAARDLEARVEERTQELGLANERLAVELEERQHAEWAAKAERDLSERIVNSLPGMFYLFDATGHFLRWNKNFEIVTGYSAEEIDRLHPLDLFRGADRDLIAARIQQSFQTGEAEVEAHLHSKDDVAVPYYFTGRLIQIDGQPCLIGMGVDISARRAAEEERDRLFTLSRDMFGIAGFDGYFKQLNPAWKATLGFELEEIMSKRFDELIHPEDREASGSQLALLRAGGHVPIFECRFRAIDGTYRWISWSAHTLPGQEIIYGVGRDVTRQKHLEEHMRQVQKLDSIGRLAAGIAHDFNNLLTVQQAYLSLALGTAQLPESVSSHLEQVSRASERAAALTRQLLLFSRRQIFQIQPLHLDEVVFNLAKMLRRILGEDIKLKLVQPEGNLRVRADAGMIEQVLMNLAVNARDAMPQGGCLQISLDTVQRTPSVRFDNPEARAGWFARLVVTDTGVGIPDSIRDQIFEPFFTTKEVGKGTGLGLSTAYGIVKQHEGWIEVESEIGQGTTFIIYLPLVDAAEITPRSAEVERIPRGGHETILVVEDEQPLRDVVVTILQRRGYRVLSAIDGHSALEVWKKSRGSIDLVLTDMIMPGGLSGRDVADRMRQDEPELKVILTSGYSDDLISSDLGASEKTSFLQKPYLPRVLEEIVREMLGTETPAPLDLVHTEDESGSRLGGLKRS